MVELFIRRPVLSLVISLLILFLGLLALLNLPVTQFPDIVPPSVTVTAKYTGANSEVCAKAVATPLERSINGVPGMTYMSSVSTNNGTTVITIYFKVGTDPDLAAVAVQNRVQTVMEELPEEVIKAGIITQKEVNSMLLYLNVMSSDSTLDEKFVFNFTDINILSELKRIDGVGFAEIMGAQDYSMRIWLKPDRLASYNVAPDEIVAAIRAQNVEAAPGKSGESSGKDPQMLQYIFKYTGKFYEPEQFRNIVIRAFPDGTNLKIKDVADVEFGSLSYSMASKTNGKASASIMLKQRPGSNAREVIENIKLKMKELQQTSFPPGLTYAIAYDVSRFLDASMHEVIKTLIEAFILVSLVVYLFLQDFRSTLIPALAVPVALIGTFFFMQMLGFSVNLLTLFALVLGIGIVVDNAIVVVEAVHAKFDEGYEDSTEATIAAMNEISAAIIGITLVMSAVFVPVSFMSGPVGVFYRQFSLTLAIAIVLSGINALTLTPVLCALMLKKHDPNHHPTNLAGKFFAGFNSRYNKLAGGYAAVINRIAAKKTITIGALVIFILLTYGVSIILPSGFIPTEDQGMIYVNVTTPAGATVERTEDVLDQIYEDTKSFPFVESLSSLAGYSILTESAGASYGMAMINLAPWDKRKESVQEVMEMFKAKTAHINDAKIEFFPPPTVPGFGNSSGFEVRLLDRTGSGDLENTDRVSTNFVSSLQQEKSIGNAFSNFDAGFPQYLIHIDQDRAMQKGVTVDNAMNTLQTMVGSYYASNFIRFGQMYKVMVQALPEYRAAPDQLTKMYVKNSRGEMVAFSSFMHLEKVNGPEQLTRYNMYTSAMISGEPALGKSSGDAINAILKTASNKLPKGFTLEWSGMTREEIESGNQALLIFPICLLFVYLILAAQYESFLLPLPVILCLPPGILGSYVFLKICGLENNIYAQVSLVMLIGLLGKNAILIIEYSVLKMKQGMPVFEAAREGALARLRPILMTSFAFVAGLLPLCFASGAGALGNRSIGTSAAGGMATGTILGLLLIPGLFILFSKNPKAEKHPTT